MRHCVARDSGLRKTFLFSALLATLGFLTTSISVFAQANNQVTASSTGEQAPFQLKVTSNLVVVRVVVRDAQNKPVQNLTKEDFKLFDRGKKQSIVQFAVEAPVSQPSASISAATPGQPSTAVAPASAMPRRFLALYFDDLNTSATDVMRARDAADHYLAANLQPGDRVGIFTSATSLSDFTDDPKQIHDALFRLHASPLSLAQAKKQDCPDLSDYQAQQIIDYEFDETIDAWQIAIDQALNDPRCVRVPRGIPGQPQRYIANLARNVIEQALTQSRANLQKLDQVVRYVSQMPGERSVILVSPGFLSRSEQSQLDQLIDHALRSQVVISSLDPKGLANILPEGDVSRTYLPAATAAVGKTEGMATQRESAVRDVLAEVAEGTGGEFVHNNNDLQAGFAALAPPPAYYLAFDPTDIKQDGKFHELKVELAEKYKGFSVQARRGYFAPAKGAKANALATDVGPSEAESQAQEQLREAVLSKTELQQLPVTMDVKVSATKTDNRELALTAHLDPKSLHFRKDGQRNLNNVTFVFAIFDAKNDLVQVQRGQAKIDVSDAGLQNILRAGLKMDSTFELKPGDYRVREVVTDSEEHHMTALSREVNVSTECCAPPELASNQPRSPNQPPASHDSTSNRLSSPSQRLVPPPYPKAAAYVDYPLHKLIAAVPTLNGIKPDSNQDQLPEILSKVGEATVKSLSTVPNLSSREDVYTAVLSRDPGPANSIIGMEETPELMDIENQLLQSRSVEFNYLLLFDHHADGATSIKELRTDFKNRQVASPANGVGPHGFGFAYQWLLLTPANQSELRFRYLGQQRMDDHKTFVLGFVQIPDQVKDPGEFAFAGKEAPFFFQGIVWIDQSTFDVVRLRTDLLAPVASVNLQQMTTELHFHSVRIHGFGADLWLPSEVLIRTAQTESIVEELHQYSAYRFFHAESRLLP